MLDRTNLSNGFLPLAPLEHDDPTAIGVFDLESRAGITWPLPEAPRGASDQLILARLHAQPLALLHRAEPPGTDSRADLIEAVWTAAHLQIERHIASCGCLPIAATADELRALLDAEPGECSQQRPPRPSGRAAIVVCTVGTTTLRRTLASLASSSRSEVEIIVVDNRPSRAGTREMVERLVPSATYMAEPRPGLSAARNAGVAAAASATYVAFTDDDVVVDPEWLAWLLAPFVDSQVQATTGLVLPLSLESPANKRFERYAGFGKGIQREIYDMAEHRANDRFLFPYFGGVFGSGNSMAFRRDALMAVGGFDAALGAGTPTAGGEDLAAFSDVILSGGRLVYEPRSLCWHEHRGDEAALRVQAYNYGIGLTAVLWRYMTSDWRFSAKLVQSLPEIARLALRRSADRAQGHLPADLTSLEQRGRLVGPWRYTVANHRSRTERRSSRRPPGALTGGDQTEGAQAGAQTRT